MTVRAAVAGCLLLGLTSNPSFAQTLDAYDRPADAVTARAQREQIAWLTDAYIADSAFLNSALAAQGGTHAEQARDIQAARVRATHTLEDMSLPDHEHQQARTELQDANAKFADLIREVAKRNPRVAAYERTISSGIGQLISQKDSNIRDALDRYAAGDRNALDDLEELIILDDQAREAAARKETGGKLRFVAVLMDNERENGRRTTRQVVAAYEAAAGRDPDNFFQWLRLAELAHSIRDEQVATDALSQAEKLTSTPLDRAQLLKLSSDIGVHPTATKSAGPDAVALAIYRDEYRNRPFDAQVLLELINQLQTMAFNTMLPLWDNPQIINEDSQNQLRSIHASIVEARSLVSNFEALKPNPDSVNDLERIQYNNEGVWDDLNHNYDSARDEFTKSLSFARKLKTKNPHSLMRERQLENALHDAARHGGSQDQLLQAYVDSAKEAEHRLQIDPEVVDYVVDDWSNQTDVGILASRIGKYEEAAAAFDTALAVGRKYEKVSNFKFMVSLTLPRLARAKTALGDLEGAAALRREELEKEVSDAGDGQLDSETRKRAVLSQADTRLAIGDLAAIGGRSADAIEIYTETDAFAENLFKSGKIDQDDKNGIHHDVLVHEADAYFRLGSIDKFIDKARAILNGLKTEKIDPDDGPRKIAEICGLLASLADAPGSGVTWPQVVATANTIEHRDQLSEIDQGLLSATVRLAMERSSQVDAPPSDSINDNLKHSLDAAYRDYRQDKKDGSKLLVISFLVKLSMLPGGGVSPQEALDFIGPLSNNRAERDELEELAAILSAERATATKP